MEIKKKNTTILFVLIDGYCETGLITIHIDRLNATPEEETKTLITSQQNKTKVQISGNCVKEK